MSATVTAFLDHYLDTTGPVHSAVMINGPWGAGKTHFIKAHMEARRQAAFKADPQNERVHLYVSLNGVRTFHEVRDLFFAETNPVLNSTTAKLIGTIALRAVNAVTNGAALTLDDARRFLGRDIAGYVLVFDDLERCAMPLQEMMGFINDFVEHEGMKVVILASEDDIRPDELEEYRRRKEKLVGKSLEVRAQPELVYDAFVSAMRHEPAQAAAVRGKAGALDVFRASGSGNLRSVRAVLEDFDRLVAAVDPRLGQKEEALERLLLFMMATGVELRAGRLTSRQVAEFYSKLLEAHFYASRPNERPADAAAVLESASRYPTVGWSDPVVPSEAIARLFSAGCIDVDAVNAVLSTHAAIVGIAETPAWRRLWSWFEGGAAAYGETRTMILAALDEASLVQPEEILHVAGSLIDLRKDGDDLLNGADLVDFFERYVARVVDADRLAVRSLLTDEVDFVSYAGLGYTSRQEPEFGRVREVLLKGLRRATDRALERASGPLILDLKENPEACRRLYDYGRDGEVYGGKPILAHVDVGVFANLCLKDGCVDSNLMGALKERYSRDAAGALKGELAWRDDLFAELEQRAGGLAAPFSSRASHSLAYWRKRMEA